MAARRQLDAAIDEGRTLLAQEKRSVVMAGLRSNLDKRSGMISELMPVRALLAAQEAGLVESSSVAPIPRVRTLPELSGKPHAPASGRPPAALLYAQAAAERQERRGSPAEAAQYHAVARGGRQRGALPGLTDAQRRRAAR